MTAEAGLRDKVRSIQPVFVIATLSIVAASTFVWLLLGEGRLLEEPRIPWPLFAVAYFFIERKTVNVHFRGEAHSFSMSDLPTVIGAFYLPPHQLLLAQLLGTLPAFGWARRQPLIKTVFNSALYAFTAVLLLAVVRAVPDVAELDPKSWAAVLGALTVISLVSALLISVMISQSSGAWPRNWSRGMSISTLITLTNGCVGLLAVLALRNRPLALLLFAPPAAILWVAYRAYTSQQQRQASLAQLNRASQETAATLSVDELSPKVISHACDLLAAEYSELVLISEGSVERWVREAEVVSRDDDVQKTEVVPILEALADGGVTHDSRAAHAALRGYLSRRGLAEAAAAPLSGAQEGFLLVGNRYAGTRGRFETEDVHLLENLADHVAVLITNARLVEQLQASLDATEVTNEQLMRSIADRDAAEQQRSMLEERLRHSHKMEAVGRLAGGIAHDFNNLLAIISGYAEMLRHHGEESGDPLPGVSEIVGASERGARLVKQLLLFSREGESPEPEVLDLNQIVLDIQNLLSLSGGRGVIIECQLDPTSPKVRMDRGRLDQVLLNLAVNARDAMGDGGKVLFSTEVREESSDQRVCLKVSDTGKGMPPEVSERAFEPFFTTKKREGGTGLGLATVYAIVEQAGGRVELDSVEGVGTTFGISLPLVSEDAPSSPSGRRHLSRVPGPAGRQADGSADVEV